MLSETFGGEAMLCVGESGSSVFCAGFCVWTLTVRSAGRTRAGPGVGPRTVLDKPSLFLIGGAMGFGTLV